jgi:hypothetical protein
MGEAKHMARVEQKSVGYNVWLDIPEEKRPFGRPRRRWEKNSIVYLKSDRKARTE